MQLLIQTEIKSSIQHMVKNQIRLYCVELELAPDLKTIVYQLEVDPLTHFITLQFMNKHPSMDIVFSQMASNVPITFSAIKGSLLLFKLQSLKKKKNFFLKPKKILIPL